MNLLTIFQKEKPSLPPIYREFDFKKDTEFLFTLIATLLENERFKIQTIGKKLLNDSEIIEISQSVTSDTMTSMSASYKHLLTKYVDEGQLIEFVAKIVVKNTVQMGLNINKNVV